MESHFNPQWRVACVSKILDVPTDAGVRRTSSAASADQECLLTTHAPFVPSDLPRKQVVIFGKDGSDRIRARRPDVETYGATFDTILRECFGINPPISQVARDEVAKLQKPENADELEAGIGRLGPSVEKVRLMDLLRRRGDAE
jgi:hypothetical protein